MNRPRDSIRIGRWRRRNIRDMEELLRELSERMERIEANQETILRKLNESIIYPKLQNKEPRSKSKAEEQKERIEEIKAVLINSRLLRDKFNLAATPQSHRVLAYLRTGNPAVFDGLKRKS